MSIAVLNNVFATVPSLFAEIDWGSPWTIGIGIVIAIVVLGALGAGGGGGGGSRGGGCGCPSSG